MFEVRYRVRLCPAGLPGRLEGCSLEVQMPTKWFWVGSVTFLDFVTRKPYRGSIMHACDSMHQLRL